MSDKDFIKKYLEDFSSLVKPNDQIVEKIISARDILVQAKKNNNQSRFIGTIFLIGSIGTACLSISN